MVTPALFKKYPDPAAFAAAPLPAIEKAIQSTGFFRNKAKSIKAVLAGARRAARRRGAAKTLDELVELAGVGRKTANVVLGVAFGKADGRRRRHARRPPQPPPRPHAGTTTR